MDTISEKAKAVNEARDKAVVSVKAYAKPKFISALFELFVSIVAITGIQFVECGFNLSALYSWQFWVKVGCSTIGIYLLYRAIINARFEKTAMRQNVVDARNRYNELNKQKDLSMKEFLKIYNLQTKIDAYISMQNKKIAKIEKKLIKCFKPEKKYKLEVKLENLKSTITNDYVTDHIELMHIKYYIVFYSDFQDESNFGYGSGVYTRGNYDSAFNKASFKKMWMYVLSSALLGVSVFTNGEYTIASVMISIISSAVMITTRIVTALLEADSLYDKTITRSLYGRIEVLEGFVIWKKDHPTTTMLEQEIDKMKIATKLEYEKQIQQQVDERLKSELLGIREQLENVQ